MKAKKALAVLLVAVMLLATLSFGASAADEAIVSGPIKTVYTDSEYFNPQGLVITVDGEEIEYSPIDENFKFVPGLNEKLTVDTEVTVYYKVIVDVNTITEVKIGTIDVDVSHIYGEITYMDNNFHGKYCLGCGIVDDSTFGAHNVKEYIPNDDGGLFIQQSETGTCEDCHAEITRKIPGTEKFDNIFTGTGTETENLIVKFVRIILVSLVQMLTGIN